MGWMTAIMSIATARNSGVNPDRIVTVNRARHTYFAMRRHCRFLPPSYFYSKATKFPESAILLENHGGVLITCDSLQYWTDWSYCTPAAKMVIRVNGFSLRKLIGTFWLKAMTPKGQSLRADFERLLKLEFKHLLGAHGRVCRNHAHDQVVAEVDRVFGS